MRTIKLLLATGFLLAFGIGLHAQVQQNETYLPKFAIKTNALYLATTTPNLGIEFALAKKLTLDVSGNYNPWKFSDNRQIKHWLVQPELRYWLCERFNGSFLGIHGLYGDLDFNNLDVLGLDRYRYDGPFYGGGISYGYQWIISKRWSMEATIGLGFIRFDYDKYAPNSEGGEKIEHEKWDFYGPTKLGLSFIYVFK